MKNFKIEHIISWGIAIILLWFFFINGYPKIVGEEGVSQQFESWGYSANFTLLIGIIEIVGAILVLIPRTAFWGALLLFFILLGALYTHISYDLVNLPEGVGSLRLTIILLLFAVVQIILTRGGRLDVTSK